MKLYLEQTPRKDKEKKQYRWLSQQDGAAAVEFAFALMALLFFFVIYMQFIQIFIEKQRLGFAGFTASRIFAVNGKGPAVQAAKDIVAGATFEIAGKTILMEKVIPIPRGLSDIFSGGEKTFRISKQARFFDEQELRAMIRGDN